ncbi:MAG TPA: hypothetical protein VJ835_02340 [Fimbriimonadaceae bacterium]|nr:hypothetical protein [Fimbriimonadaceae bacterium]
MSLNQVQSWFRRQAAPITLAVLASVIVMAFFWWFTAGRGMDSIILFTDWQDRPWTLFTYPWAEQPFVSGLAILSFVFLIMWVFWVGGTTERDLSPGKYIGLWIAMILLPALFIVLLGPLVAKAYGTAGMWLPVAGITVVWCTRNPRQTIMLYGLIPLSGFWLGWVTVVSVVLLAGFGNPVLGLVSALHLPIAWAFASNRIPGMSYSRGAVFMSNRWSDKPNLKKSERLDKSYFEDVKKREKEREERERLRKLFESSLQDDQKEDG